MLRSKGTVSPIYKLKLDHHFRRHRKRNTPLPALLLRVWSLPLERNWLIFKTQKGPNQAGQKDADRCGRRYTEGKKNGRLTTLQYATTLPAAS